jgi:hypothetical protein
VTILREVALGRRDAGGPFGERFKKIAARIRIQMMRTVHVVDEHKFAGRIERLVLRSGKTLKGFPWGYCTCGSSPRDLGQAKCLDRPVDNERREPDKSKATLFTCSNCPHHLTHEGFRPYVSSQIDLHERAAKNTQNGQLIRNASRAYVQNLRQYYDRAFTNQ